MPERFRDKRVSLEESAQLVQEGDVVALGGLTLYRRPMAFVGALLRRDPLPRGLSLLCFTAGMETDLLIGAGLVTRLRTCYCGLEAFGLAPMFTKLAAAGEIQVIDETEASIAFGLRAEMAGVSFMPGQGWIGTDLPQVRPDVKIIDNPYGTGQYVAFPAIRCDVAVIHALRADRIGNAYIGSNVGIDPELPMVSQRVVITTEELVEELDCHLDILGLSVDAVVHAPRGAWPTSCYPLYPVDGKEIMRYSESCPDKFSEYLAAFVGNGQPR